MIDSSEEKTSTRAAHKEKGMALLEEMFTEQSTWDTLNSIRTGLNERGFEPPSSATLFRWLKEIGAKATKTKKGQWILGDDDPAQSMKELDKLFEATKDDRPLFFRQDIKVAVIQTKLCYNKLIAMKIEEAFDEVLSTICPNDIDIIIVYKLKRIKNEKTDTNDSEGDDKTNYRLENTFVKQMREMINKYKPIKKV